MSRSRAFNRFNRFIAKKRRSILRGVGSNIKEEKKITPDSGLNHQELRHQDLYKENILDYIDPNSNI